MIIKGEVHLGSSLDEIEVSPGGRFVLQEIEGVEEHLELDSADPERGRRFEITADAEGNVERAWTVDGATRRIDDEAREWIDGILGRLDDAHLEFSPAGSDETRTLIFAGDRLALVGEAHTSAGTAAHGVLTVTEGDRVLHLEPNVVWTTHEGEEGKTIELHLAEPILTAEGAKIDLHLSRPIELEEGGAWTIHIDDPENLLDEQELGESIVLELKKVEGGEIHAVVAPSLKVIGEDDERRVIVVVPKGHLEDKQISAVFVHPKVEIIEEGGEGQAEVVVKPRIVIEPRVVAEARVHPRFHFEFAEEHAEEPLTIVIERSDDEEHRHSIRMRSRTDEEGGYLELSMRGEVDLGETVDDIRVGEDGELTIDARDAAGVIRQLSVRRSSSGELLFEYYVDGEERPFDDAARTWLQEMLERFED
jgi:hypothetical protein